MRYDSGGFVVVTLLNDSYTSVRGLWTSTNRYNSISFVMKFRTCDIKR